MTLQITGLIVVICFYSHVSLLFQPSKISQNVYTPVRTSSYRQNLRKDSPIAGNTKINTASSKPAQGAISGCDDKLVELINTAIVDRSPSVKWNDVGKYSVLISFCSF